LKIYLNILFCYGIMKNIYLFAGSLLIAISGCKNLHVNSSDDTGRPNIILILSDDIGYGDIGCYGASLVKTPNIDRLAAEGVRFTNAYSPASTCTPTRFSLLTGKYAWRTNLGVMNGDAPMSIEPGSFTMPAMFQQAGYTTACIGKWHLGLGEWPTDYNRQISPGLRDVGFDYSFYIPATNDRVPCVYIENDSVVGLEPGDPIEINYMEKIGDWPTGRENPELLKLDYLYGHDHTIINGISRIGYMTGGTDALWVDETIADTITAKAVRFIRDQAENPFFLYFAPVNIHEPRTPGVRFAGKSDCGVYCDFIEELDWSVGEIIKALEKTGLDKNTWVIFTSDNGPEVAEGYRDGALENLNGHDPKAGLRGGKYTLFEAGTRMPFILWWPGEIKPTVSNAAFGFIDLFASYLCLLEKDSLANSLNDSRNALDVLLGQKKKTLHNEVLIQDNGGRVAIIKDNWKYIPEGSQTAGDEEFLFNIKRDMYETENLIERKRKKGEQLKRRLEELINSHP
jgi:arylsulfatase A-like enzyme